MSLPVVYQPEAQDDINAAYDGYERQAAGLGQQFLEELRKRVDHISANPALYGVIHQDVRAAPMRRFPHVVYFRAEAGRVLIIAVQHGRRSTRGWQGRV